MVLLQLACAGIIVLYVAVAARRAADPRRFLARLALLAAAAWAGEDTCIRLYGFYSYSPDWSLFLGRTPLLIVLIWPLVIDSAERLARSLLDPLPARARADLRLALLTGAIVLCDASLIEPIAVRAGLWRWTEPGLFAVPPVGILGWAFFAAAAVALPLPLAPVATHALLLASWWGALRWVNGALPSWPAVAVAWAGLAAVAAIAWRRGLRRRVPLADMLVRVPPALLFFALLALHAEAALCAYACAFAPPYLALVRWNGAPA